MKDIKIIDNFLDKHELLILNNIVKNKEWFYGHTSGGNEIIRNCFFANYNLNEFFSEYIHMKIKSLFSKNFKLNRNYMHVQTFGQDGAYHIDDVGNNKFTFCLYLTDNSNELFNQIGGDLFIKIPNEKHIVSIDTINNRGVLFNSTYIHKGMAYNSSTPSNVAFSIKPADEIETSNEINYKRLCITWKLEEIF